MRRKAFNHKKKTGSFRPRLGSGSLGGGGDTGGCWGRKRGIDDVHGQGRTGGHCEAWTKGDTPDAGSVDSKTKKEVLKEQLKGARKRGE